MTSSTPDKNDIKNIKMEISGKTRVAELLREYPELMDYFLSLGLCGCEYGHDSSYQWPLIKVSKEKKIPLEELISQIKERLP